MVEMVLSPPTYPPNAANRGFSIGIGDVTPSEHLSLERDRLVREGYALCSEHIEALKKGKLELMAGCNEEQSLEVWVHSLFIFHVSTHLLSVLLTCLETWWRWGFGGGDVDSAVRPEWSSQQCPWAGG